MSWGGEYFLKSFIRFSQEVQGKKIFMNDYKNYLFKTA
jgi:hypothetical protein